MPIIFTTTQRVWNTPNVETNTKVIENSAKTPGAPRQRFYARVGIGYLKGIMKAFGSFRCEANLVLMISDGKASFGGKVSCRTTGIDNDVRNALQILTRAANNFAERYPRVAVTLSFRQVLRKEGED